MQRDSGESHYEEPRESLVAKVAKTFGPLRMPKVLATSATAKSDTYFSNDANRPGWDSRSLHVAVRVAGAESSKPQLMRECELDGATCPCNRAVFPALKGPHSIAQGDALGSEAMYGL